ncbi:MAG: hypothetical protein V9F04_03850 [Dermatophilaceae bacterium]
MAVTVRGGRDAIWREEESERVIFHSGPRQRPIRRICSPRACRRARDPPVHGPGRARVSIIAAAEAFFSSLEWEVLSRNEFQSTTEAATVVIGLVLELLQHRPAATAPHAMMSPVDYENAALTPRAAA